MKKSEELRQEAAAKLAEARGIKDAAEAESRKLKPEERDKIDRLLEASNEALEDAKREERMAGIESNVTPEERGRRLPDPVEEGDDPPVDPMEARRELTLRQRISTDEYRAAFEEYVRFGESGMSRDNRQLLGQTLYEARAMVEGVDADGGYLVPDQLVLAIEREEQDLQQLEPMMDVIPTGAKRVGFNREDDASLAEWGWIDELQAKPESQPSLDRYYIDVHTAGGIIRVSDELLEDTQVPLESYLATIAAERKVEIEETAYLNGNGTLKPWGILTRLNGLGGTPQRYTTAGVGAIAGDDFLNILYALPRRYRRNAAFVVGSQVILAARLLKDGNDNYIWQPGLQAGEPDRLIGKPVIESPDLALDNPIAGGNDVAVVGDLKRYRILRRLQMQVKRLEELYAATDEVGFRFRWRVGGDVRTVEAFKTMRVAAA